MEESHFELESLPNAGFQGKGKIFTFVDSGKLFFLYSNQIKNTLYYDFKNHKHRTLPNSKIPSDKHNIESTGIRVGKYFWILGGRPGYTGILGIHGFELFNEPDVESVSTLIWSIPRQKWILGPELHEELQYRSQYMCRLAVDSKTAFFIYPPAVCSHTSIISNFRNVKEVFIIAAIFSDIDCHQNKNKMEIRSYDFQSLSWKYIPTNGKIEIGSSMSFACSLHIDKDYHKYTC